MLGRFKAVIFDMDGVIIDAEMFKSKAYEKVIATYGKKAKLNEIGTVHEIGTSANIIWQKVKDEYNIDTSIEDLAQERIPFYLELISNEKPMPGFDQLIQLLSNENIDLALASSSMPENVDFITKNLGVKKYFKVILNSSSVTKHKPDPEIYLLAATKLGVEPKDCLVIEDSGSGILAAKTAGMTAIAVPNWVTKHQDFSTADLIVKSLTEINKETISSL